MRTNQIPYILGALALVALSACVDDSSAAQAGGRQTRTQRQQQAARPRQPTSRDTVRNPTQPPAAGTRALGSQLGGRSAQDSARFVEHVAYIRAGVGGPNPAALRLRSPFATDPQVKTVGSQLYHSYNCVDCHGMDGSGAIGPSLADGRWRFGGSASEVFESIYQGRPDGMPAWGGRISEADIWRLVEYVRSLEVGKNVSTENFTGKAQQRMGH
jgi:mono/diheme cytochrome c family protein